MAIKDTLQQLEREILKYADALTPARYRKFKGELQKSFSENSVQIQLLNMAISAIDTADLENKQKKKLVDRFNAIPNRFPLPNSNDQYDMLIYGRFMLGYAVMKDGRKARRTATGVRNAAGPSKYVAFLKKKANISDLNGDNFKYLCGSGFPQATHEYMYVNELTSIITDQAVINESQRLLTQMGY